MGEHGEHSTRGVTHTSSYSLAEMPHLSRDASASTYTSFPELNKSTERPLSTNAELCRSSVEADEDGLFSAYTLSTLVFSKSWERRNDPRPPVDPVSNTATPVGCETIPLTGNVADPSPTEYFSIIAPIAATCCCSRSKFCDAPRLLTRLAIRSARS